MEITKQEAQLLFAAVDESVKSGGIAVASQLMNVAAKLNNFINAKEEPKEKKEDLTEKK